MPMITYSEAEYEALKHTNRMLSEQLSAAQAMRPQWAMGYTSDSIAAQTTSVALQQVWDILGVSDQTACIGELSRLYQQEAKRL